MTSPPRSQSAQEVRHRLEELEAEVQITLSNATAFVSLLDDYLASLGRVQDQLLLLKERIENGEFNPEIQVTLENLLGEFQELMNPAFRRRLQNQVIAFENFCRAANAQCDELTIQAFKNRIQQVRQLLD